MQQQGIIAPLTAEDQMRAHLYSLVGHLLFTAPTPTTLHDLQSLNGDDTPMGRAFAALHKQAATIDIDAAQEEYNKLFIGIGRGELLPYGSYYLTGFLNEKPLAYLRTTMARLGIMRHDDVKEPEDHIGSLFEMMAGLITGRYGAALDLAEQKAFFTAHIAPWAAHFFNDLEKAESSHLYQPVGTIGKLFIEIETAAFAME